MIKNIYGFLKCQVMLQEEKANFDQTLFSVTFGFFFQTHLYRDSVQVKDLKKFH